MLTSSFRFMKSTLPFGSCAGAALLLLGSVAALAQPTVTAVSPAANQRNAPRTGPVQATFSQSLGAGSSAALKVFGSQRGGQRAGHSGTAAVSGNTLTFRPNNEFAAGEKVQVTITTAAQNASGQPLAQGRVFDFVAATSPSAGVFAGGYDDVVGYAGLGEAVMGDLDNDGDLDFLQYVSSRYTGSAGASSSGIRQYINNGNSTFSNLNVPGGFIKMPGPGAFYSNLFLSDFDGDGDLDLLHNGAGSRSIEIEVNNGRGEFTGSTTIYSNSPSGGGNLGARFMADLDGDGDLDMFQTGATGNQILLNNGAGTFTAGAVITAGGVLAASDVDGDGDLDLVGPDGGNYSDIRVQLNDGRGVFTPGPVSNGISGTTYSTLQMGDVDGDNDVDIVASTYATANTNAVSTVDVRLNDGSGVFTSTATLPTTIRGAGFTLADVDGNGALDILINSTTGASIFYNNGTASFMAGYPVGLGNATPWLVMADIDQDGDLDLITSTTPAVGNYPSTYLHVRFNQNAPLATKNSALAAQMSISPNPAHARFAVTLPALPGTAKATLTLRNALGQVVLTKAQALLSAGTQADVEAPGLAAGLYLLSVQAGADTFTKRVVLE